MVLATLITVSLLITEKGLEMLIKHTFYTCWSRASRRFAPKRPEKNVHPPLNRSEKNVHPPPKTLGKKGPPPLNRSGKKGPPPPTFRYPPPPSD